MKISPPFSTMTSSIKQKTLEVLFHVRSITPHEETRRPFAYEGREERPAVTALPPPRAPSADSPVSGDAPGMPPGVPPGMGMSMEQLQQVGDGEGTKGTPFKREKPKVGRNDPCPCGSGKKYKKCHGASS